MAKAIQEARPRKEVVYRPHRPAVAHFAERPAEMRRLAFDSPPDIPQFRLNTARKPNDRLWDGCKERIDEVLGENTAGQLG